MTASTARFAGGGGNTITKWHWGLCSLCFPSNVDCHTLPTIGGHGWQWGLMKSASWYKSWNWGLSSTRAQSTRDFLSRISPCVVCGKTRWGGVGIFCRNFCVGRGGFPPCRDVWCGECYEEFPTDPFPRLQGGDANDENKVLMESQDKDRYQRGRNGDHLMGVPFECNLFDLRC